MTGQIFYVPTSFQPIPERPRRSQQGVSFAESVDSDSQAPPPTYQSVQYSDPHPNSHWPNSSHIGQNYGSIANSSSGEDAPIVPHYPELEHKNKKDRSMSYDSVAVLCLFFLILVPLSGLCGVWIHKSTSTDILDPAVRERIRYDWAIESRNHELAIEHAKAEEREWQEKKRQREREEAEWQWERQRMRLYWDNVQGEEHCLGHGTRRYTARLENLLSGIDAIKAYRATPFTIHGVTYDSPAHCDDRGFGVYGHWVVTGEPICSTFWHTFSDKGCLAPGSGLRRVESSLGGLRSGDDPLEMCFSTPASIGGQNFEGPAGCEFWFLHGWLGYWDVPDDVCR